MLDFTANPLICTKFSFGWASASDPVRETHNAPPDLAGFGGGEGMGKKRVRGAKERG